MSIEDFIVHVFLLLLVAGLLGLLMIIRINRLELSDFKRSYAEDYRPLRQMRAVALRDYQREHPRSDYPNEAEEFENEAQELMPSTEDLPSRHSLYAFGSMVSA